MKRPKQIVEIMPVLTINAIGLILGSLFLLLIGYVSHTSSKSSLLFLGTCLFLSGLFLVIVAIEFYRLKPWTHHIVKLMLAGPLVLRGAIGLKKTITDPELMRAFGLIPGKNKEQRHDNEDNFGER